MNRTQTESHNPKSSKFFERVTFQIYWKIFLGYNAKSLSKRTIPETAKVRKQFNPQTFLNLNIKGIPISTNRKEKRIPKKPIRLAS